MRPLSPLAFATSAVLLAGCVTPTLSLYGDADVRVRGVLFADQPATQAFEVPVGNEKVCRRTAWVKPANETLRFTMRGPGMPRGDTDAFVTGTEARSGESGIAGSCMTPRTGAAGSWEAIVSKSGFRKAEYNFGIYFCEPGERGPCPE